MKPTASHAGNRTARADRPARTTHRSPATEAPRTTAGLAVFVGLSVAVAGAGLGWAAMAAAGVALVAGTVAVAHATARDRPVDAPEVARPDPVGVARAAETPAE
jgi:hypothetical protein